MYHGLCIHSSFDGYLCLILLYFLAIMSNAATIFPLRWVNTFQSVIAELCGKTMFNFFIRDYQTVFQDSRTILHSHRQ